MNNPQITPPISTARLVLIAVLVCFGAALSVLGRAAFAETIKIAVVAPTQILPMQGENGRAFLRVSHLTPIKVDFDACPAEAAQATEALRQTETAAAEAAGITDWQPASLARCISESYSVILVPRVTVEAKACEITWTPGLDWQVAFLECN
jgi:hypothetical protein